MLPQIFVSYGKAINAVAFQYIEDGKLVNSPLFGDKLVTSPTFGSKCFNASNFAAVVFKEVANNEYVTRVSGAHALNGENEGLISLTIETNAGCYGPFGNVRKNDIKFEYSFGPGHQFGGFHGLYSPYNLRSIGVYINPISSLADLSTSPQPQG
ncbi:inactive protein RESTRICTED TEV MOVEMENT 1-like [Silene latifolia]|uniref:inactive protein RESTRICTED TEV MOVEMENT 1-like n=1 Tax=Silene latifolia TaxID=37657 RepID=UPI003D772609